MPCSRGDGPSLVDRGTSFGMLRQKRSHITVVRSRRDEADPRRYSNRPRARIAEPRLKGGTNLIPPNRPLNYPKPYKCVEWAEPLLNDGTIRVRR
jgi:hypothetical protein